MESFEVKNEESVGNFKKKPSAKKKIISVVVGVLACFIVLGVIGAIINANNSKSKTFERNGVKITADASFTLKTDNIMYDFYLASNDRVISVEICLASEHGYYDNVQEFTDYFLTITNKNYNYETYNEDGVEFTYFEFTNTASGKNLSDLVVCIMGETNYYVFNFICETKNYSKNKDTFMKWAKKIEVQ